MFKFCDTLKDYTIIESVKLDAVQGEDVIGEFKHEIEFYTKKNLSRHKKAKKEQKRQEQCD